MLSSWKYFIDWYFLIDGYEIALVTDDVLMSVDHEMDRCSNSNLDQSWQTDAQLATIHHINLMMLNKVLTKGMNDTHN